MDCKGFWRGEGGTVLSGWEIVGLRKFSGDMSIRYAVLDTPTPISLFYV